MIYGLWSLKQAAIAIDVWRFLSCFTTPKKERVCHWAPGEHSICKLLS